MDGLTGMIETGLMCKVEQQIRLKIVWNLWLFVFKTNPQGIYLL